MKYNKQTKKRAKLTHFYPYYQQVNLKRFIYGLFFTIFVIEYKISVILACFIKFSIWVVV